MRTWFMLLLLVWVISCSPETLPPAQSETQMVDQANRIILEVDGNPKENYKNITRYLTEEGFRLHLQDNISYNIQTAYKPFEASEKDENYYIRINTSVRDSTIYFSGEISRSTTEEREIKKVEGEDKDNLYQKAWQKLLDIAEGYPHEEMYFSRN